MQGCWHGYEGVLAKPHVYHNACVHGATARTSGVSISIQTGICQCCPSHHITCLWLAYTCASQVYGSYKYPRAEVQRLRPGPAVAQAQAFSARMLTSSATGETRRVGPFHMKPGTALRLDPVNPVCVWVKSLPGRGVRACSADRLVLQDACMLSTQARPALAQGWRTADWGEPGAPCQHACWLLMGLAARSAAVLSAHANCWAGQELHRTSPAGLRATGCASRRPTRPRTG